MQTAISLWPQLQAVNLPLGSPAVASGADTAGSWLGQFMAQVAAQGLRVDFIALHWFSTSFDAGTATSQLQQYLAAVYALYQRPIWLTQASLAPASLWAVGWLLEANLMDWLCMHAVRPGKFCNGQLPHHQPVRGIPGCVC